MPLRCMTPVPPRPQARAAYTSLIRLAAAASAPPVTLAPPSPERGTREGAR